MLIYPFSLPLLTFFSSNSAFFFRSSYSGSYFLATSFSAFSAFYFASSRSAKYTWLKLYMITARIKLIKKKLPNRIKQIKKGTAMIASAPSMKL